MKPCPCCSGLNYGQCCEPYITGVKNAPTAEAFMRSRYSAYVEHAIDYILETCTKDKRDSIDPRQTRNWSERSKWKGLKVISTEKGGINDTEGTVEFEALYEMDGLSENHHETATFKKIDGRWLYDEGDIVPKTVVRNGPKLGRNDPCPCGSGKKYKFCCAQRN